MAFVVDASIALGWLLQSQGTSQTAAAERALAREEAWVPSHFGVEVTRALRRHERRSLISAEFVDQALAHLRRLPLKQEMIEVLDRMPPVIALARRYELRIADAAYLDLAQRLSLPLATRDASLARAAEHAGVALFTA